MPIRPLLLLTPSAAAALELPRRLAAEAGAIAGVYAFPLEAFARAVAEPALLGRGLRPWHTGHAALLAARLLKEELGRPGAPSFLSALVVDTPRSAAALALARSLSGLRRAGIAPESLETLARRGGPAPEDTQRLALLSRLYRRFHDEVEGIFADGATLLGAARERLPQVEWLEGGQAMVVDDLELEPLEADLMAALAARMPVLFVDRERPAGLRSGSFAAWAQPRLRATTWEGSALAPLGTAPLPAGLLRLRSQLFETAGGGPVHDGSVELLTAAGEAAEVRALVRRLLREAARGVPFEQMGVVLPRPDVYAPLLTDLLERLGIPYRLHPSLPLRHGRAARSLLLLLLCRGLRREAVLEFLTFAPIPFAELLGAEVVPRPAQWDAISREAGIVSGLPRWILGLRAFAEAQKLEAEVFADAPERRQRILRRADEAEALLRLVELLSATLEALAGEAEWSDWAERLTAALDQWVGPEQDRAAVAGLVADLGALRDLSPRARWEEVEAVLEARLEWERMPLTPQRGGAVHVGAMDAIAGVPFRVVAIPGLVEGGYPGVIRPDPFLLDPEREALAGLPAPPPLVPTPARARRRGEVPGQLALFDEGRESTVDNRQSRVDRAQGARLPTAQDRLLEARRAFHRALGQARERLVLSYPRADPRTGRERAPSLFFVAAASALAGRPLSARELAQEVVEDDAAALELADTLDASERDRLRVRRGGAEAVAAVAAGSSFFKWSHLSAHERWSRQMTAHDGLVSPLPPELAARLDPLVSGRAMSASALARYATCGFLYLLEHVLGLEPALEPEERIGLDPLERGRLFHEVAEAFLRERRDRGELPVRDDEANRRRLLEIAREKVDEMVAGSPPRHALIWALQWGSFEDLLQRFLAREAANDRLGRPAHFEIAFGTRVPRTDEPHSKEPLEIDLGEGRRLRVSGKIDRIDVREDGTLVLRDYKTGKAPRDDTLFRGGRQLQIPFYVLAARKLFPERKVSFAFLDYVDAQRAVTFDLEQATGESFRALLLELAQSIAGGRFVQEPASCQWCDFTAACGPRPLLELRRRFKQADPNVLAYVRLRDYR